MIGIFPAVECPGLTLHNGNVVITGTNSGDLANYTCVQGYTLVGSTIRECTLDGLWSGDEPSCFHELNIYKWKKSFP